jgi:rhamnose utilization protein RhaD (predicted bifunctional aldolase and dehydrogenase)
MKPMSVRFELDSLLNLSARLGVDPLLTQASNGNTSMKLGQVLWIKASGKWLSNALQENIFVPIDLPAAKDCLRRNNDLTSVLASLSGTELTPSIETAMHLVLGQRVVVHVHSVNAIALAVRSDARQQLRQRLHGLRWEWVPYVLSGLPLARAIEQVVRNSYRREVIVLGNHGLIVCAKDCHTVEALLDDVESRLMLNRRRAPHFDSASLRRLTRNSPWRLPEHTALHALATDVISRNIVSGGVLYPCQAVFLGGGDRGQSFYSDRYSKTTNQLECQSGGPPFVIVEGKGVLIRNNITSAELETLLGLVEVIQRIDDPASVRYLTEADLRALSTLGAYRRRSDNFARPALSA